MSKRRSLRFFSCWCLSLVFAQLCSESRWKPNAKKNNSNDTVRASATQATLRANETLQNRPNWYSQQVFASIRHSDCYCCASIASFQLPAPHTHQLCAIYSRLRCTLPYNQVDNRDLVINWQLYIFDVRTAN